MNIISFECNEMLYFWNFSYFFNSSSTFKSTDSFSSTQVHVFPTYYSITHVVHLCYGHCVVQFTFKSQLPHCSRQSCWRKCFQTTFRHFWKHFWWWKNPPHTQPARKLPSGQFLSGPHQRCFYCPPKVVTALCGTLPKVAHCTLPKAVCPIYIKH